MMKTRVLICILVGVVFNGCVLIKPQQNVSEMYRSQILPENSWQTNVGYSATQQTKDTVENNLQNVEIGLFPRYSFSSRGEFARFPVPLIRYRLTQNDIGDTIDDNLTTFSLSLLCGVNNLKLVGISNFYYTYTVGFETKKLSGGKMWLQNCMYFDFEPVRLKNDFTTHYITGIGYELLKNIDLYVSGEMKYLLTDPSLQSVAVAASLYYNFNEWIGISLSGNRLYSGDVQNNTIKAKLFFRWKGKPIE